MPQQNTNFEIQSKIDNQMFTVNRKIIVSSTLLKNICDITDITEPIIVPCSGDSLNFYIKLINAYQSFNGVNEDVKNLYKSVSKNQLITIIQDLCFLDSDIFLDSVADYFLEIFEEASMDWNDIQEFLGLENDFTQNERELILKEQKLEYFLSIDAKSYLQMFINYIIFKPLKWILDLPEIRRNLSTLGFPEINRNLRTVACKNNYYFKFPFANKNLYSLKTDYFSTPLNALIARIIQRSNESTRYLLSLINKSIKNEVDRHPLMLTEFHADRTFWNLQIDNSKRFCDFHLNCETFDESYFNALKKRKIITKKFQINFDDLEPIIPCSFDFVFSPMAQVTFARSYKSMYQFDVKKCQSPSIFYWFNSVKEWEIKFEKIYKHLIAKDLSKEITEYKLKIPRNGIPKKLHRFATFLIFKQHQREKKNPSKNYISLLIRRPKLKNCFRLQTFDIFKFFDLKIPLNLYKKPNASKFHTMNIFYHEKVYPEFKEFVTNYMDDEGLIESSRRILGIPAEIDKVKGPYTYPVSVIKKYLGFITID